MCEDHTIKRHCQSAADAFPTGDHASSPKDVISDVMHVYKLKIHGCMQLLATMGIV